MAATDITVGSALGEDGRYRLKRSLGNGGMSTVWLAHDLRLEREVAIKVLAEPLAADDGYVARFAREARVAAQLSHPHLVNVYDFDTEDRRPYLVMEYVAAGTLAQRLQAGASLRGLAPSLAAQLLDALECIHRAGIIHRDIKPSNILIDPDERARLADFGVARPSDATALTDTGVVIGTLRYIAPEVMAGERASAQSDLYACGVVLRDCAGPRPARTLAALIDALTDPQAERRPPSAQAAIALLDRAPAAPPRPSHPRVVREGRTIEIQVTRRAVIGAVLALIVAVALAVVLSGTATHRRSGPPIALPPASASLAAQLHRADQLIATARR
ncbi:MAG TPA: serine/threonine-protein kinase [Solirubrobacteraceae bacterium]|nr:serine/threonine-protein kinase [Solirubrobacteraceae bacterium]